MLNKFVFTERTVRCLNMEKPLLKIYECCGKTKTGVNSCLGIETPKKTYIYTHSQVYIYTPLA